MTTNVPVVFKATPKCVRKSKCDFESARRRPEMASTMAFAITKRAKMHQNETSCQETSHRPRIQNHCQECNAHVAKNAPNVARAIARTVPTRRSAKNAG